MPPAISKVLGALPATFPAAVLVLLHGRYDPGHPPRLTQILAARSALPVHAAVSGLMLPPRGVIVAPPGCSTTLDPSGVLTVAPTSPIPPPVPTSS
ncbi:MAG TPA: chemotaxis protein CheB [Kineosporiaceae bacterium]